MPRKIAELIWLGMPSETRAIFGYSLEAFLEDIEGKGPDSKFILHAAQKHIRQRNER
jgi:hypothetical protein